MNQILDKAAFEPFAQSATDVLHALSTGRGGLSQDGAANALSALGRIGFIAPGLARGWSIFLDQFKSFLIGVLVVAALVSAVVGEHFDAIAILIILVLNAALGSSRSSARNEPWRRLLPWRRHRLSWSGTDGNTLFRQRISSLETSYSRGRKRRSSRPSVGRVRQSPHRRGRTDG
jgi:hypothetical protein